MQSEPISNGPRSFGNGRPNLIPPASNSGSRHPRATPVEDDDDATFSSYSNAVDNSSILGSLSKGPLSAVHSDISNSRVDLLAHLRPKTGESSASLSRTESIQTAAPPTIPIEDESDHFDVLHAANDESSAVDLGSRHEIHEPLLADSQTSGGSAVLDTLPRRATSSVQLSGSAAGSFNGSASGHGSVAEHRPAWTENKQAMAWGGGAAIGLLAGGVLFAALSAAGLVQFGSDAAAQAHPRFAAELRHSGLRSNELQNRAQDLQAEALAARTQVADARAKLEAATRDLQLAKAEQSNLADEVDRLRKQVASAQANADQAREAQRVAVERALSEANDRIAKLSAEQADRIRALEQATAETIRAEAAQAVSARKALSDFQRLINEKLSDANLTTANARPEELLAAVDRAITQQTKPRTIESPNAERLLSTGLRAFRDRDYALAESSLSAAAKANQSDARIRYLLGLARRHLGRADDAQSDFFVAASLERKYQPSPREVDEILVRLPVADRGIVGQYRP